MAEKAVKHEGDSDTNCIWCTWNNLQSPEKETGRIEDQNKNRDSPDHSIVKTS